jgi:hypothetical protein
LSLRQCLSVLERYDIKLVCPIGLDVSDYRKVSSSLSFEFIDPRWQQSYRAFNRLKISPFLYSRFRKYEFILFYELDAFVFRDELQDWCDAGYDYIGAPWFENFHECTEQSPFIGVGNGGFSLRRTRSALRALWSFSYIRKPRELLSRAPMTPCDLELLTPRIDKEEWRITKFGRAIRNLTIANNTFYPFNDFSRNEDLFWGHFVRRSFAWFKVASFEDSRKFSFESNARLLFRLNENKLPFGCHAWRKQDPTFWAPHIREHAV